MILRQVAVLVKELLNWYLEKTIISTNPNLQSKWTLPIKGNILFHIV